MPRAALCGCRTASARRSRCGLTKLDTSAALELRRALLGEGRKDESGDFTKGAGLAAEQIEVVMGFVSANRHIQQYLADQVARNLEDGLGSSSYTRALFSGEDETGKPQALDSAAAAVRNIFAARYLREIVGNSLIGAEGVNELETIAELLDRQGYGPDRILIDPGVVRGLGYYTGPVFEMELLFEARNEEGQLVRFGSVGGGGRYDGLVSRFLDEPVPATGFSIGVSRLLAALQALGKVSTTPEPGPVLVLSGPEGGLSPAEVAAARAHGFVPVTLGGRVLRAETAPLATLAFLTIDA